MRPAGNELQLGDVELPRLPRDASSLPWVSRSDGTGPFLMTAEQAAAWFSTLQASSTLPVRCRNTFLECPTIADPDWLGGEDAEELLMLRLTGGAPRRGRSASAPPRVHAAAVDRSPESSWSLGSSMGQSWADDSEDGIFDEGQAPDQERAFRKLRLCKSKRMRFWKIVRSLAEKAVRNPHEFDLRAEELPRMITANAPVYAEFRRCLGEVRRLKAGSGNARSPKPDGSPASSCGSPATVGTSGKHWKRR